MLLSLTYRKQMCAKILENRQIASPRSLDSHDISAVEGNIIRDNRGRKANISPTDLQHFPHVMAFGRRLFVRRFLSEESIRYPLRLRRRSCANRDHAAEKGSRY